MRYEKFSAALGGESAVTGKSRACWDACDELRGRRGWKCIWYLPRPRWGNDALLAPATFWYPAAKHPSLISHIYSNKPPPYTNPCPPIRPPRVSPLLTQTHSRPQCRFHASIARPRPKTSPHYPNTNSRRRLRSSVQSPFSMRITRP